MQEDDPENYDILSVQHKCTPRCMVQFKIATKQIPFMINTGSSASLTDAELAEERPSYKNGKEAKQSFRAKLCFF